MTILTISALATPRAQPRARHLSSGRVVSTANDRAAHWKKLLEREAGIALRADPEGFKAIRGVAIGLDAVFYFATKDRPRWGKPHTAVPDRDNLDKLVMDALVAAGALGGDDRRVADGRLTKLWAPTAGVIVTIRPWGSDPIGLGEIVTGLGQGEAEPDMPVLEEGATARPAWLA